MKNADQYLTHSAGIYALLAWNDEQKDAGTATKISNQTVYIHPLASRYFALGIAKKKNMSKVPFLAIQPAEAYWMKLVQWDKAYIRERDMHLYLVSKVIKGDNIDYPDIPSFAVAISFDTIDKINLLKQVEIIEGREYRQENGEVRINFLTTVFDIQVEKLEKDEPYLLTSANLINYTDIMSGKEQKLQSVFSTDAPPEFLGDVGEAISIATKYWKNLTELLDKTTKPKK